jgi:hypothetical protein
MFELDSTDSGQDFLASLGDDGNKPFDYMERAASLSDKLLLNY